MGKVIKVHAWRFRQMVSLMLRPFDHQGGTSQYLLDRSLSGFSGEEKIPATARIQSGTLLTELSLFRVYEWTGIRI
jgi:hypothetical protein